MIEKEGHILLHSHEVISNILKEQSNKRIIFIYTSNVYDGELDKPHIETDIPKAESDYGKFKLECENLLLDKLGVNTIIARVSEIWRINCQRINNFVSNITDRVTIL